MPKLMDPETSDLSIADLMGVPQKKRNLFNFNKDTDGGEFDPKFPDKLPERPQAAPSSSGSGSGSGDDDWALKALRGIMSGPQASMPVKRDDQGIGAFEENGQVQKPSLGQKIIGMIGTGLSGAGGGLGQAGRYQHQYFDQPYQEALGRFSANQALGRQRATDLTKVADEQRKVADEKRKERATVALEAENNSLADLHKSEVANPKLGTPAEQALGAWLKANPGKTAFDYAQGPGKKEGTDTSHEQDVQEFIAKPPVDKKSGQPYPATRMGYQQWRDDTSQGNKIEIHNMPAPGAGNARSDKSYQYNSSALDKISTPIEALGQRVGRLQDTLKQNSPQADALLAPELLTIMAGGQGSGLRMNEAEIGRIIGGRSKWQDFQAAVQKWSTDPSTANSVTTEQRQQIRALVDTVAKKLAAKQNIINGAHDALLDSDDPKDHRRIVGEARNKLMGIDSGESAPSQSGAAAAQPIVQRNKATGATRYSVDGGKTWQTGNPPK